MEWDLREVILPRQKLMIGMTGNVGGGSPAINAVAGTIGAYIEGRSLGGIKRELGSRGIASEVPMPAYGYMRKDEFYHTSKDEDLINDWVWGDLSGLIRTDRKGRNAGRESPICQIPCGNTKIARSCRWHMRT